MWEHPSPLEGYKVVNGKRLVLVPWRSTWEPPDEFSTEEVERVKRRYLSSFVYISIINKQHWCSIVIRFSCIFKAKYVHCLQSVELKLGIYGQTPRPPPPGIFLSSNRTFYIPLLFCKYPRPLFHSKSTICLARATVVLQIGGRRLEGMVDL